MEKFRYDILNCRKFFFICALSVFISFTNTLILAAPTKAKPFVELQGQIIEVEGSVSTIEERVDLLVEVQEDLQTQIDVSQSAISSLKLDNETLHMQITEIGSDTLTMEQLIIDTQADTDYLEEQILLNSGDISFLQIQIDENNYLIQQLTLDLEGLRSLEDQVKDNQDMISVLKTRIEIAEEQLLLKQHLVNGTCPSGYAMREIKTDGSVICEQDNIGSSLIYTRTLIARTWGLWITWPLSAVCDIGDIAISSSHRGLSISELHITKSMRNPIFPNIWDWFVTSTSHRLKIITLETTCMSNQTG